MEAATEALADRTPEEAVLMQEEMNFKEFGIKPLVLLLLLLLLLLLYPLVIFFIIKLKTKKNHRPPANTKKSLFPAIGGDSMKKSFESRDKIKKISGEKLICFFGSRFC